MVNMARKGRNLLITLCVIVGLIIVAVAAVRLLLTREKLLAIVIPRVEKTIDAKVSIEDIGISFPFGFGVDIDGLSFEKVLSDTSTLAFTSRKVTVRASLMSLIRRKPEIQAADVQGGAVTISNPARGSEIRLRGLDAHGRMSPAGERFAVNAKAVVDSALVSIVRPNTQRETTLLGLDAAFSMRPEGEGYAVGVKALVDSLLVSVPAHPPAIVLEKVGLDGALESDREFNRLVIKDTKARWEDLVTAKIEGEVINIKTAPRVALTISVDEKPLAPVLERVKGFKLDELSPAKTQHAKPAAPRVPVETSGGTFGGTLLVEGLAREPLAMNLSFECGLKGLSVKAGDIGSIETLSAAFKGQGVALAWQSLFPDKAKPVTPAQIGIAWQAVKLDGAIEIAGGDFVIQGQTPHGSASGAGSAAGAPPPAAPPVRISSMKAKAEISGPDVRRVSGEFNIGSSPCTFSGSLINIMPAAAELALVAQSLQEAGETRPPDLGVILDRMVNAPVVKLELSGRSFDARPYQKPLAGGPQGKIAASAPAPAPPAAGGPGAVLFLKNTAFTAKLDSIVLREAVLTRLEVKGAIRDGRVTIDPATFAFAGGKGAAVVSSDLRKPERVETKVNLSLDGVEAGEALARLTSAASLVQGKFSFKSNASLVAGPGIDPLLALSAAGSGLSSKGTVIFESFIEPLTKIQGFDVTPFRKFEYREWAGTFVVKDGRFITDDWKIDSSRGAWLIKGSFGFDGTLDYAVHVVIPPDVQKTMKDLDKYKSAFDLMRDKTGSLVLDIKVGGTAKRPSTSLDLTNAKNKVQDKLIEGLKKKFLR